ncbi:MAG: helix-turn-helix transcriptional regulator [Myxococcota bacterium]
MDAGHARMERLLGLITLLLNETRPVSFRELRETVPYYEDGNEAAAQRRFERDKAALVEELGIPIRYVEPDPDLEGGGEGGYVLERQAYYLPDLQFTPEEMTALWVAGSAARSMAGFPWAAEVERAMEKIRFASGEPGEEEEKPSGRLVVRPQAADPETIGVRFAAFRDAIARRKRVQIVYRGLFRDEQTKREVDPIGLFLRDGVWCLYAMCHLRGAMRTFHLHRIESFEVNKRSPRKPDFDPPAGLDLGKLAKLEPWQYPVGKPVRARVVLEQRLAFSASAIFGEEARVFEEPEGRVRVELEVTNEEAFLELVLSLRDGAKLLEPESFKKKLVSRLDSLIASFPEQEG